MRLPKSFSTLPDIQHELPLATALHTYEQQCQCGQTPDSQLLQRARQLLLTQLEDDHVSYEVAHLGVKLCSLLKDTALPRMFLTRYLAQPLSEEEEAWARWQLVDHLALARQHAEAYAQQKALLAWSAIHFPPDEQLWTISDSTQAQSWLALGCGKEWSECCARLLAQTPREPSTRHERYCALRTATDIALEMEEIKRVQALIAEIRQLAQEDRGWEEHFAVMHEVFLLEIKVAATLHQMPEVRRLAQALALFELEPHRPTEKEWGYPHNLGAVMYFLQQYDLTIPALRRAIDLGSWSEHTHLWLAAALWADEETREDRHAEVLALLTRGTQLATGGHPWEEWRSLPEFLDQCHDLAFVQATRGAVGRCSSTH